MSGDLAAIAQKQLSAWEQTARQWPVIVTPRDDGCNHLSCAKCGMTLIPVDSATGTPYELTHEVTLAALVAHLRNVHRSIESEVYGDA